jgi:2-polyprenyl-3-methyl-5-hydroxy-6-metoxy-1,4-benzoquinol methylase
MITKEDFKEFYKPYLNHIYLIGDKKKIDTYLEEAQLSLDLLSESEINQKDRILEIGGGLGFLHGYLKKRGFDIISIEPSGQGFDDFYKFGLKLFDLIKVDNSSWYPYPAEECDKLNKKFDVIFSNNVIEHIGDVEKALKSMKVVLDENGKMIHNTVNYTFPYDAHTQTLLIPLFPKKTEILKPSLKKDDIWNSINFITSGKIKSICNKNNLKIKFKRGIILKSFERLDHDEKFRERQRGIVPVYNLLKKTNLIKVVNLIPLSLTTPITFEVKHKK